MLERLLRSKLYQRWGIWATYYDGRSTRYPRLVKPSDRILREKFIGPGLPFKRMAQATIRELQSDGETQLLLDMTDVDVTWEPRRMR